MVLSGNGYSHPSRITREAGVKVGDCVFVARPVGVGAALKGIPGNIEEKARELKLVERRMRM